MTGKDSWFRKKFREAEMSRPRVREATPVLSKLRSSHPPSEYEGMISAFRAAAPQSYRALVALGPRSTSELVRARAAFEQLSLKNELLWARLWLRGQAPRLNCFRQVASEIQSYVIEGKFSFALEILDEYVRTSGWSLWAVELRAALLRSSHGGESLRVWLSELQSRTVNSIPGVIFQIVGDRNDETYSYDAVYTKCINSFPRLEHVAPWLVDYLKFRGLGHVENSLVALPRVLSRDISSSLIDYYESLVETLSYVEIDESLYSLRSDGLDVVNALLEYGYKDHRLNKLKFALSNQLPEEFGVCVTPTPNFQFLYFPEKLEINLENPISEVFTGLEKCRAEGAAAYDVLGKMLKWGVNFKGIEVGPAVALTALYASSREPQMRTLPLNVALTHDVFSVHDAAALSLSAALLLVDRFLSERAVPRSENEPCRGLTVELLFEHLPAAGPLHLWFGERLLEAGRYEELTDLITRLRPLGEYWQRHCAKLEIAALCKGSLLAAAVRQVERWLRIDPMYAVEFPCDVLFDGNKWSSFKNIDPVEMGLVSHYAYERLGGAPIAYICKMACRAFLYSGMRENVVSAFASADLNRKAQLVAFLRDVWIEQNLALCHEYESTSDVRIERMKVLQLLLGWEPERAVDYAEAIKDLTFDQTLQRGLEQIDKTRIFVNESAITRWAEKDLLQDFERWKKLSESDLGNRPVDDLLRQYALDPENIGLLREFAEGRPTAADVLLIDVVDRLYKRFLFDPTDGLDTYLSVRIRHGSFRGTILGPLEEQGLLYSATGFSEDAFSAHWDEVLKLSQTEKEELLPLMESFSRDIRELVDDFVREHVQVARPDKPNGAFSQNIAPFSAKLLSVAMAERPPTFYAFLSCAYFVFWKLIEFGLARIRLSIETELSDSIRFRIGVLIQSLRNRGLCYLPLVTNLTTVATTTKSQCDTVSEWFRLPGEFSDERYELPDAIEIATVSTNNVHRAFSPKVEVLCVPSVRLPLTTSGLAVLADCLFVIFENAWKHSGLGSDLASLAVLAEFDSVSRLLTIEVKSALSPARERELTGGELGRLRTKYLGEIPLELISREGGSGFPKLARLTRSVASQQFPKPFEFGIEEGIWYTRISVPLYEREGAYEAYE